MKLLGSKVNRRGPAKARRTDCHSAFTDIFGSCNGLDLKNFSSVYKKQKQKQIKPLRFLLPFHNSRPALSLQSFVLVPGTLTRSVASNYYMADRGIDS